MILKCIECNYSTNRKSSYLYHCGTQKHLEKVQHDATSQNYANSRKILREVLVKSSINLEAHNHDDKNVNKLPQNVHLLQCKV